MKNKEKLEKEIQKEGMKIGCYSDLMEKLSQKEFKKVFDNIWGYSDTDVKINRKEYVVQIDNVDDEVDFTIITKSEYINRYGNERYEEN
jgi:hypothetical protein